MRPHGAFRLFVTAVCAAGLLSSAGAASAAGRQAKKPAPKTPPASQSKPSSTKAKPTVAKPTVTKSGSTRTSVARARSAARAKAAAAARQQREASSPRFKRDALGNLVPDVRAAAAIVFNPQTGEVLWEENSHETRSIASLTKIMTAVTFVADDPDMNQQVLITRADTANASVTHLRTGDLVTWGDLLHLTLIASDNAAARALARTAEGGTTAFVGRMNDMARQLGLTNTHYLDPSGLVAANVSSAYDMSHLIAFAATDARIGSVMRTADYVVRTPRREIRIHSTNKLLSTDIDVRGGKTGFISKAGYCLATLLQIPQGNQVAVVVLGAANSATRFWEARHLFNWVVGKAQGIIGTDDARPAPAAASIR
ncbi:MAG: D-alanyl-D-alanine carboxypeptidase [Acidobacteria bacterium]|nr:D-alanyl-D-alanine carboxypeptidase [Acidobacteriota bacterium]